MEDGGRWIERYRVTRGDARIVPALVGAVAHDRHMIGEDATEAGIDQQPCALLGGKRLDSRFEREGRGHGQVLRQAKDGERLGSGGAHVVHARGGQLGQRGDVIEKPEQPSTHAGTVSRPWLPCSTSAA